MEQRPHISVEVARFRPFYILGAVNHPGEYPYRPGLTVLQALGIAGGLYRPLEGGLMQAQGPVTGAPGDLRILLLQYDRLLARRARLQAELDGAKEINFPADLADNESEPEVGGIIKQERAIFETRRDGLEAQLTSRGQVKDVLVNDLASLKQKIAMTDKEFALIKDELNKVSSLVSRGWATGPQQLQWQQNVLQIQRQQLDLQTAALHVQQEIAKANEGILALENDRHEQLLREMEDTSAKLSELGNKMGITEDPSEQPGSLPHVSSTPLDEAHAVFAITRAEETGTRELDATEATRVLPGDTIKVKRRAAEVPVAKNGTSSRDHAIRAAARTKAH